MPRSLRVRQECIQKVKLAVKRNGFPSQRALAEDIGLALATVSNFLTGKPVDYVTFEELCQKLALSWREIADLDFEVPSQTVDQDKNTAGGTTNNHQDWGEAIDVSNFYGRSEELATLKQWIINDHCRLITLIGMGGIGKTALSVKLAEQIQDEFEYLIWRSLHYAPPLLAILTDLNEFLSNDHQTDISATIDGQISRLLNILKHKRCLLILDDCEMVLRGGDVAGYYRQGYEGYGKLLKRVGEEQHQSCLLLLSREKPVEVATLAGETLPIRVLQVKGLKSLDAKQLLATKGFTGTEHGLDELIQLYRGHPAALKVVATTIKDLFNGNVMQFLGQSSLVIGDIFANLLNQHFERLSDLEKAIMFWLAIECQPILLAQLKADIGVGVSSSELLAMLESLRRRCLIEKTTHKLIETIQQSGESNAFFTLQPMVMKYVINIFIEEICQNIIAVIRTMSSEKLGLLKSHALVKQDSENIQAMQIRLILTRVRDRLQLVVGDIKVLEVQLQQMLSHLRNYHSQAIGYAEHNLLLLLRETEQ
ncbi:NB-ARC domain-containing protein [Nostoc sp.]